MALFVKQDEERSELQQKIAADIEQRQRAAARTTDTSPDGVEDSRMIEGTSHMTRTGWVIIIALIVVALIIIVIAVRTH